MINKPEYTALQRVTHNIAIVTAQRSVNAMILETLDLRPLTAHDQVKIKAFEAVLVKLEKLSVQE